MTITITITTIVIITIIIKLILVLSDYYHQHYYHQAIHVIDVIIVIPKLNFILEVKVIIGCHNHSNNLQY